MHEIIKYLRKRLLTLQKEKSKTTFIHKINKINDEINIITNLIINHEKKQVVIMDTNEINSGIEII